jgi:hypothetical protein
VAWQLTIRKQLNQRVQSEWVTWRFEFTHRAANVPYFTGMGGITPRGGNTGLIGSFLPAWFPDLRKRENRFVIALLVKL